MTIRPLVHGLAIAAVTAVIMLATLLPFVPGGHDTLAVPLSTMAQVFGIVGLLLEPVGALWVASAHSKYLADKQYGIAIVALIAASQQTVTSHRLDRLQLTPSELVLEYSRGHYAVHNAGHPHWKYFWFD